jgi:hypothetical protein
MKPRFLVGLAALALVLAAACNKPSEDDCRAAAQNIQRLANTDKIIGGNAIEPWVRRCRGVSTKESVRCIIAAQTAEQLKACNLDVDVDTGSGKGTASGSASGSASPPPPTTPPPTPTPTPTPPAAGSGTGSASGSGSASASGAPSGSGSGSASASGSAK